MFYLHHNNRSHHNTANFVFTIMIMMMMGLLGSSRMIIRSDALHVVSFSCQRSSFGRNRVGNAVRSCNVVRFMSNTISQDSSEDSSLSTSLSVDGDSQAFATTYHAPVMFRECISAMLDCERGRIRNTAGDEGQNERLIFVDGTLGGGGHSKAMLEHMQSQDILIGCDRDPVALETASVRLRDYIEKGMFIPHRSNFRDLASTLKNVCDRNGEKIWEENVAVDGLLLDLGVSSHQIDSASRGFSYSRSGPLDMRMDSSPTSTQSLKASHICNEYDENSLVVVLKTYGDEPRARKIAKAIIDHRPHETTGDLVDAVSTVTPEFAKNRRIGRTATLARVFQALRMVVNEEDTSLTDALAVAAPSIVCPGGRLVVLTYHSLEDRATKRVMKDGHEVWQAGSSSSRSLLDKKARPMRIEKDLYGNEMGPPRPWKTIGKQQKALDEETKLNSRARSATLRVAERQASL